MNIALRRDCSKVLIFRIPQVGDLTCERIVDRERVGNLVEHRLGLGNNRSGSRLSEGIKNTIPGSGAGLKLPVNPDLKRAFERLALGITCVAHLNGYV